MHIISVLRGFMSEIKNILSDCNPVENFVKSGFCKYRQGFRWERNCDNDSLYYINSGKISFTLDTCEFIAHKGEVVLLSKNQHAMLKNSSDEEAELFYIAFYMKDGHSVGELGIDMHSRGGEGGYRHRFIDINDAYLSGAPASFIKAEAMFLELLYQLVTDKLSSDKKFETDLRISKLVEHININYYKKISIDELCRMSGYSVSHLRRLFVGEYGVSPHQYLISRRIVMSKELLCEHPEKSVEEIAELVGMCDTAYFCRMFKANVGVSPKKFRDKLAGDE